MKVFGITIDITLPENVEQAAEDAVYERMDKVGKGLSSAYKVTKGVANGTRKGIGRHFGNTSKLDAMQLELDALKALLPKQ